VGESIPHVTFPNTRADEGSRARFRNTHILLECSRAEGALRMQRWLPSEVADEFVSAFNCHCSGAC